MLATAGIATVALIGCNGFLLWLYQHSSLGVVITLGTFVAAVSLAWLRNRGRQLTAIVVCVQALVAVSAAVGVMVALNSSVWTGIFASGITLGGLALLSLIGLLHYTGDRARVATAVSMGTALAVVTSMLGAYAFLSWDYQETSYQAPYVAPPEESVDFLIENGQYYRNDGAHPAAAERDFTNYTCEASREEIAALFATLVHQGEQRLATPEDVTVTRRGQTSSARTVTITATIHVIDDLDGAVIEGPEKWTFHLEKRPRDTYWRVCQIDRPA